MTVPPAQLAPGSLESADVISTRPSQLSVAVGVPNIGVASHAIVVLGGVNVKTGGTASTNVNVWLMTA